MSEPSTGSDDTAYAQFAGQPSRRDQSAGSDPRGGVLGMGNSMGNYHPRRATKRQIWGGVAPYPTPVTPCSPSQSVRTRQPTDTTERYATRSLGNSPAFSWATGWSDSCPYPHGPDHGPAGLEMTTLHRTLHPGRNGPPGLAPSSSSTAAAPGSAPVSGDSEPIRKGDRRAPGL